MELINGVWMFESEQEALQALKKEGKRLEQLAIDLWRQYLNSYKPERYVRKGKSLTSIKLGVVKKYDEDTLCIELTWEDDLTYHDSYLTGGYPKGNSIMLISEGWAVSRGWHRNIYRFGYYEGWHYLDKLVKAFEAEQHKGIVLEMQNSGKAVKLY